MRSGNWVPALRVSTAATPGAGPTVINAKATCTVGGVTVDSYCHTRVKHHRVLLRMTCTRNVKATVRLTVTGDGAHTTTMERRVTVTSKPGDTCRTNANG